MVAVLSAVVFVLLLDDLIKQGCESGVAVGAGGIGAPVLRRRVLAAGSDALLESEAGLVDSFFALVPYLLGEDFREHGVAQIGELEVGRLAGCGSS